MSETSQPVRVVFEASAPEFQELLREWATPLLAPGWHEQDAKPDRFVAFAPTSADDGTPLDPPTLLATAPPFLFRILVATQSADEPDQVFFGPYARMMMTVPGRTPAQQECEADSGHVSDNRIKWQKYGQHVRDQQQRMLLGYLRQVGSIARATE